MRRWGGARSWSREKRRSHEPTAAELRWQREALRLRDKHDELWRLWKTVDTRGQMKRDKELRALGLDQKGLELEASKTDLVNILMDVCRLLQLGAVSEVVPGVSRVCEATAALPGLNAFTRGVCDAMTAVEGEPVSLPAGGEGDGWCEARLAKLRELFEELSRLRPRGKLGASSQSESQDQNPQPDAAWKSVAAALQLQELASPNEVIEKVAELRLGAAVLQGVLEKLRCGAAKDLPQALEAVLQLCDERVAAQRIVDALQKLLHVSCITEVLPALKDVLDMSALRRRALLSRKSAPGS